MVADTSNGDEENREQIEESVSFADEIERFKRGAGEYQLLFCGAEASVAAAGQQRKDSWHIAEVSGLNRLATLYLSALELAKIEYLRKAVSLINKALLKVSKCFS